MRQSFKCVYSKDIREIDSKSSEIFNMPSMLLMENAAKAVSDFIMSFEKSEINIVCGKGNNGGDGLAVARQLLCLGKKIKVFYIGDYEKSSEDVKLNMKILLKMNADIKFFKDSNLSELRDDLILSNAEILIDAIFGIGFQGELREDYKILFDSINGLKKDNLLIVSIDIPSGINGDNGQGSSYIKADYTVTFQNSKVGHFLFPGRDACGKLIVKNISAPYNVDKSNLPEVIEKPHFSYRPADGFKGTFGHVGVVGGSYGMTGAGVLAVMGALKTGAGIVSITSPVSYSHIFANKLTEAIIVPITNSDEYTYSLNSFEELISFANNKTSLLIGPGLGREQVVCDLVLKLISKIKCNMVIDADAIFALSKDMSVLKKIGNRVVLTPHYGEMSFLTGLSIEEIKADKINIAKKFVAKYNVNLVLKGADTITVLGNGDVFINQSGCSGMGSGGSGDVLAGMISANIKDGFDFVPDTVFLHGKAGELAQEAFSGMAMTSFDIASFIGKALKCLNVN